ncbi:putative mediator complex, subunit Med16 [Septoria linicola]|nr:putative mediator complex, subunit Med16 [Septoria linicola]
MDVSNIEGSVMPDASMMDPNMDDLFGEAANDLVAAMPATPLPAPVFLRLAEMQSRGCCTKLAWSNTGSIAQIAPNGSSVFFRAMVRHRKTGAWTMSEASKHPIKAPAGRRFVHIQFNGIGIELAVIDDAGAMHMHTLTGALSKMTLANGGELARKNTSHELNAVVGLHWLPLFPAEFRGPYLDVAHKNGDKWEAQIKHRDQHALKAHHPAEGRHALLHISRSNELTLLYQNEGAGWQSVSVMLHTVRSSDEYVSHAAMGEDGADLLAVTHDHSSQLRLYRITIHWNATQLSRGSQQYTQVAPELDVHHLTAIDKVRAAHVDGARLSRLDVIPTVPEAAQQSPTMPTVQAIFTQAHLPLDDAQTQSYSSTIVRWTVESYTPALHDSFKKLKQGSGANTHHVLNQSTILRRQADTTINKIVMAFASQAFDTIQAFAASDGSLDFRDRATMAPLGSFGSTETVPNVSQTGFYHLSGEHSLHVAISPDGSALASVRPYGKVTAQTMTFTHGWQVAADSLGGDNKAYIEAAAVCIARQYAFLCFNNISNDEVLALLPTDTDDGLRSTVIKMIFRMLQRTPDISCQDNNRQQMIVLKEPFVPRCLSAQLALGTNHTTGKRNFSAQYAFAMLTLRLAGTASAQTLSRQDMKSIPVDAVYSLRGLVKWSIDLMVYIVNTLVVAKRNLEDGTTPKQAFEALVSSSGSTALHLILCSYSRVILRFQSMWMNKFTQAVQLVLPRARSIQEQQELSSILKHVKDTPFKLAQFEQMLSELDTATRGAYNQSSISVEKRSELETNMMVDGAIPAELENPVNSLLESMLPKLVDTVNLTDLMFWDIRMLGLSNCRHAEDGKKYDVIRKIALDKDMQTRVCRRCGSEMEDISAERAKSEMVNLPWFAHLQRHCLCMNYWLLA